MAGLTLYLKFARWQSLRVFLLGGFGGGNSSPGFFGPNRADQCMESKLPAPMDVAQIGMINARKATLATHALATHALITALMQVVACIQVQRHLAKCQRTPMGEAGGDELHNAQPVAGPSQHHTGRDST